MMKFSNDRANYIAMLAIALLAVIALFALMRPADDTPSTRFGNAVEKVGEGFRDAGRELDPNRTTGERIGDAIEDAGDDIGDALR